MSENDEKTGAKADVSSDPPETGGGASSEDSRTEGKVQAADIDTAVRLGGGGVRTDAAKAKTRKAEGYEPALTRLVEGLKRDFVKASVKK